MECLSWVMGMMELMFLGWFLFMACSGCSWVGTVLDYCWVHLLLSQRWRGFYFISEGHGSFVHILVLTSILRVCVFCPLPSALVSDCSCSPSLLYNLKRTCLPFFSWRCSSGSLYCDFFCLIRGVEKKSNPQRICVIHHL